MRNPANHHDNAAGITVGAYTEHGEGKYALRDAAGRRYNKAAKQSQY